MPAKIRGVLSSIVGFFVIAVVCIGNANAEGDPRVDVTRAAYPEWIKTKGVEVGKEFAEIRLKEATRRFKAYEKARVDPRSKREQMITEGGGALTFVLPTREAKAKAITEAKQRLETAKSEVKEPTPEQPVLYYDRLTIGNVGRLRRPSNEPVNNSRFRVQQVIDDGNMIVKMDDRLLWLTIPTEGLVDDKDYTAGEQLFEVVGTKRYKTVLGGSKTVMQLEARSEAELLGTP